MQLKKITNDKEITEARERLEKFNPSKSKPKEINLLNRALIIAANEAFKSEVIDTDMSHLLIGNENQYQSKKQWITERIENWLDEAEITPSTK